jgi:DNA excision repair protein ERCC-4
MIIKCDDREDGMIIEGLRKLKVDCEVCRLECGDYVSGGVCIERKTIDDFCTSIIDGRMKEQASRMKATYKNNFVLISGKISERSVEINENCILGMISSLIVKYDLQVVCVENNAQLTYLMKRIFERFNNESD